MDLFKVCEVLETNYEVLPSKARAYAKSLNKGAKSAEKETKLVLAILHDVILTLKTDQRNSTFEIILMCVKYLIEKWNTVKDITFISLDILLYEAIKPVKIHQDTFQYVDELTSCMMELQHLPGGCSDQISEWFSLYLLQSCSNDTTCSCHDPLQCSLLQHFHLRIQGLNIRTVSGSLNPTEGMRKAIDIVQNHFNRFSFCDCHGKKIADIFGAFLEKNISKCKKKGSTEIFSELLRGLVDLEVTCLEETCSGRKDCGEAIQTVSINLALLSKLQRKKSRTASEDMDDKLCDKALCHFLSILSRNGRTMNKSFQTVVKCVNLFLSLKRKNINTLLLSQIFLAYTQLAKEVAEEDLETIMKEFIQLIGESKGSFQSEKDNNISSLLNILKCISNLCGMEINKSASNLLCYVASLTQEALSLFQVEDECNVKKNKDLILNLATINSKANRKTSNYLSAMENIELTLQILSSSSVAKPLVTQWLKCKQAGLKKFENDSNVRDKLRSRNLGTNLKGAIPEVFLAELLRIELQLYESLKNTVPEQISVASAILSFCDLKSQQRAVMMCKQIKLLFESQESSDNTGDIKSTCEKAYLHCKSDSATWESFIQIKLIEFLLHWNDILKCDGNASKPVDMQNLHDIVNCCQSATENNFPMILLEQTCKVFHSATSVLCLFGESILGLNMMFMLCDLLDAEKSNSSGLEDQIRLHNKCLAQCKISSLFFKLHQTSASMKYAETAQETCNHYTKLFKTDGEFESDVRRKSLRIVTLVNRAQAFLISGMDNEANELIKQCESDDFLQRKSVMGSSTAALTSVKVMTVRAEIMARLSEPQIYKLLETLRRITTWNAVINPTVAKVYGSEQEDKSAQTFPAFGLKNDSGNFDIQTQVDLIHDLMQNIYSFSESHLLLGDVRTSNAYINHALMLSQSLLIKNWYVTFCSLKIRLISLQEREEDFLKASQIFCKLTDVECNNMHDNGLLLLGTANTEDELVSKINDRLEIPHEKIGSTEEDAIEVESQPIDMDCYESKPKSVMASPHTKRRAKSKYYSLPKLFKHSSKCECYSCTNLTMVLMQMDYVCLLTEHFLRSDAVEEGLELCSLCLKVFKQLDTKLPSDKLYSGDDITNLLLKSYVGCLLTQSNLYYLQFNEELSLKCAVKAQRCLESRNLPFVQSIFHLNAKLYFILSLHINPDMMSEKIETDYSDKYLNVIIDSLSACRISVEPTQFSTPVSKRSAKMIRGRTKSKISSVKKDSKNKKAETENNFQIFNESTSSETKKNTRRANLPMPEYIPNETPDKMVVYDFVSTDEERITKSDKSKTQKKTQNVMLARKAATRRHRQKFATIYTEEEQEKVRALPKEVAPARRKRRETKPKDKVNKVEISNEEKPYQRERLLDEKISNLLQALSHSNTAGDFWLTKICSQALSMCHHLRYTLGKSEKESLKATAYHIFSIGVTMRTAIQVNAQTNFLHHTSVRNQNNKQSKDYKSWLQETLNDANPHKAILECTEKSEQYMQEMRDILKENWTVCAISLSQVNKRSLLLSRLRHDCEPLHIQIDGEPLEEILDTFNDLMLRNVKVLKSREKSYWWTQRKNLDAELSNIIDSFGTKGLGYCRGFLLGEVMDAEMNSQIHEDVKDIIEDLNIPQCRSQMVEMFLNSWHCLSAEEKLKAVIDLSEKSICSDQVAKFSSLFEIKSSKYKMAAIKRHHVILILDKDVQLLPWENDSLLQNQSMTRMPSMDVLKMQLKLLKSAEKNVAKEGVNLNNVSYVLNPKGDLVRTEKMYKDWFESITSWKGIVSRAPTTSEWVSSITDYDLFIFCGHGSGSKYMSCESFRKIRTRAAVLLMGCSSGKLEQDGIFEPSGIVLHYLISGSPCVLGCLWPVTDKDIDKYLSDLLSKWAAENGNEESLPQCARKAKSACKMPNLNGSSCVVYGLPVHCQITIAKFFQGFPNS